MNAQWKRKSSSTKTRALIVSKKAARKKSFNEFGSWTSRPLSKVKDISFQTQKGTREHKKDYIEKIMVYTD